ncbi:MAG: ribosome maturation factor RimM, partial [Oscillospiraceae bacterium]|nr:ribosome maturation factor RimM [Oscillospiraceae bacterium]
MKLDFLPIGKVTGTHGIKGELRVKPLCDSPAFFRGFAVLFLDEHGKQSVAIKAARPHKNMALLTIDGVLNIEDAQAWIGRTLYLKRDDARLDDGQYFVAELIGCQILD